MKRVNQTQVALDLARERDRHYVAYYLRTRDYENIHDEVGRLGRRMEWELGQLPLIEVERDQLHSASRESGFPRSRKRTSTYDGGVNNAHTNKPRASEAKKRRTAPEEAVARCRTQPSHVITRAPGDLGEVRTPPISVGSRAGKKQAVSKNSLGRGSRRSGPPALAMEPDPVGGRRSRRLAGKPPEYHPLS